MTYDMEERLTTALRDHADREVDADALLGGALTRGRRRQRQRRIGTAFAAAGGAGVTAVVLAAVPLVIGGGGGEPVGEAERPAPIAVKRGQYPVAALPAPGKPGAAAAPDQVGKDPATIHFGVRNVPLPMDQAYWAVRTDGVEELLLTMDPATTGMMGSVRVALAAGAVPARGEPGGAVVTGERTVRIGGRGATVSTVTEKGTKIYEVRWSPVDGLEALVTGRELSEQDVIAVAEALVLDRAARCAVPLRFGALPDGASIRGCSMRIAVSGSEASLPFPYSQLTIVGPGGSMTVLMRGAPAPPAIAYTFDPSGDPSTDPSTDSSGDPSTSSSSGGEANEGFAVGIVDLNGLMVSLTPSGGWDEDEANLVADGLRNQPPGLDPKNPETWPTTFTN